VKLKQSRGTHKTWRLIINIISLSNKNFLLFRTPLEVNNLKSKRKNLNFHFKNPRPSTAELGKPKKEASKIKGQEAIKEWQPNGRIRRGEQRETWALLSLEEKKIEPDRERGKEKEEGGEEEGSGGGGTKGKGERAVST
jgi:hypothetical protein